ncbi:MAG TPA: hypothetical protein VL403_11395, partial [Candidatus Kryptonia bacterium]|nr:hypothetical protein [Candidatus Kryptonia bacterium]
DRLQKSCRFNTHRVSVVDCSHSPFSALLTTATAYTTAGANPATISQPVAARQIHGSPPIAQVRLANQAFR